MIVTRFNGGVGNQLFQYSIGRYLAHKHNTELKLDLSLFDQPLYDFNSYKIGVFNIQENFATPEEIENLAVVTETQTSFIPEALEVPDNVLLVGFWQSHKYSEEIEDILREEFTLKNPSPKYLEWQEKINSAKCSVSCHVRRGDYLIPTFRNHSGIMPFEYYYECINTLKNSNPEMTLFVFSNDLEWVKNNFQFDVPVEFVKDCESDCEELILMSLCQHNIIANSTFSFWGARLNRNPDKKVFTPYPWHRDGWGGETVIQEDWIKVPVDFDENPPFNPTTSIILYVENDSLTISSCLQSIMDQTFQDHELIMVSASADGSDKICREIANNRNVTFLKVDHSTKKYTAWNKGLENARGDYVIFLSGNDLLSSEFISIISKILSSAFYYYSSEHKDKIHSYEEYILKAAPNIIGSTEYMVSSPLSEEKITRMHDEKFQELDDITNFDIPYRLKIALLVEKEINNLVGTKIFKRSYLNKYNIRFDENLTGEDAELKFLIDAFIHTEKISLMPRFFYGTVIL